MRFDDPSQDEDAPIRPHSIVPSRDRTSRAIRTKLLMLFAMLIMVIVLMKEAGKPERWEWMGFASPKSVEIDLDEPDSEKDTALAKSEQASAEALPQTENPQSTSTASEPSESSNPITISTNQVRSPDGTNATDPVSHFGLTTDPPDYPVAAAAFWTSTFRRLNAEQQATLLRLLRNMRQGKIVSEDQQPAAQQLARRLRSLRDQFHQSLFDELALAPDGTPEQTRLANEMDESQQIWDKKVAPAMDDASRGVDFTMSQRQAIIRLQQVLDPLLYQQVQDRTALGWTGDSAAWIRIWEKITSGDVPTENPVSRIELMGQPKVYRGKPVTVEGWVRSVREKRLSPESELGLSHYYVMWVRPKESKLGPYCVYSMTLPEDFPEVSESFSSVNEHIRLNGYSFKIRNYLAADSSVDECPVIIARGVERVIESEFTSVNSWQPSRTTLTTAFILIPLVATGLAWLAFRSSKPRHFGSGTKSSQRIERSLDDLAKDPRVQTDREKIMSLYESEIHDQ